MKGALEWAATGACPTSEQANVLLGGYIALAMIMRGGLGGPRIADTFISSGTCSTAKLVLPCFVVTQAGARPQSPAAALQYEAQSPVQLRGASCIAYFR